MNERVRELARRVVGKNKNDVSSISLFDEQIEQFAELLIRECAQHLTNIGQDYCREQIEKHFGVK